MAEKEQGVRLVDGKPEWFYNPSVDGKIGGVGVSGIHINGKTGQKRLAVNRAINSIAHQMGVKVQSFSAVRSETSAGGTSTSGESSAFFTVDGKSVTAVIKEIWIDPYSSELYVWMVTK